MAIFDIIKGIISPIAGIFDDLHLSGEEKAQIQGKLLELEHQAMETMLDHETKIKSEQASIVRAEVGSESALARNWRPITMLMFVAIIANNFIVAPYVAAFGGHVPTLDIPNGMWALLNVGIGGYIASRGAEKIVQTLRNGKNGALG